MGEQTTGEWHKIEKLCQLTKTDWPPEHFSIDRAGPLKTKTENL